MSLREEFEKEINPTSDISKLFETSNQFYIQWLENKIMKLLKNNEIQKNNLGRYGMSSI